MPLLLRSVSARSYDLRRPRVALFDEFLTIRFFYGIVTYARIYSSY